MKYAIMPCGAYYEMEEGNEYKAGTRLITQAARGGIQRPIIPEANRQNEGLPEDARVNCLLCCPTRRYRRVERGWIGNDAEKPSGKPQLVAFCKVLRVVSQKPISA